jgi:signal transduction histidine kinase
MSETAANIGTILIVEDDLGLLHLIQKKVRQLGFPTEGVSKGSEAMAMITAKQPMLLLLDYQLADMTCKTVIEHLTEKGLLPPFIIMTGHGNEQVAVEMMKLGAIDYLVKNNAFLELLPSVVTRTVNHLTMKREKENLEARLRQSYKMEAIGTLAGGIAHDFNNILAVILGYADMAMDDIPAYSPAKTQIKEVLIAANRAKELVQHILSFSRIEAQELAPIQPHLIVKEAARLLRASIPTTIEIRQDIDPESGSIMGQPTQINQILMNLCTNAAQAMDETGGILEISLDCHELAGDAIVNGVKPGQHIRLTVKDTGPGIDKALHDRIFDPYFTTKAVGKGSGMGLSVVHGIVKAHGGMITVKSAPGEGTTVCVYFPKIEEQPEKIPENTAPLPVGTERILIVDDDKNLVELTQQSVERLGYQVTAVTSSIVALEMFSSHPDYFDLILSDQTMPELTGDRLAQKVIAIRSGIPIIICTGHSSRMDAEKADFIGISAFLMKPVTKRELAETIRRLLDNRKAAG